MAEVAPARCSGGSAHTRGGSASNVTWNPAHLPPACSRALLVAKLSANISLPLHPLWSLARVTVDNGQVFLICSSLRMLHQSFHQPVVLTARSQLPAEVVRGLASVELTENIECVYQSENSRLYSPPLAASSLEPTRLRGLGRAALLLGDHSHHDAAGGGQAGGHGACAAHEIARGRVATAGRARLRLQGVAVLQLRSFACVQQVCSSTTSRLSLRLTRIAGFARTAAARPRLHGARERGVY
jgi:hypothetical protein